MSDRSPTPAERQLPVMTGMTFGSDCIVNGVPVKAGTVIKFASPGEGRDDLAELLWTLYEGIYGHRHAENIDPFKTAVGGALEVKKAWDKRESTMRSESTAPIEGGFGQLVGQAREEQRPSPHDKEHDPLRAALEYIASGKWGDHESASGIALRALEETPSSAGIACIDERTAMLLAAISTASIQNTRESAKERVGRDNPYCTQAYLDVCAAVDREMAQRERAERAEADLGTQSATAATSEAVYEALCELLRHADHVSDGETDWERAVIKGRKATAAYRKVVDVPDRNIDHG